MHSQRARHFPGELFPESNHIRELAIVLLSPDVAAVAGIDQLGADVQCVPSLRDSALEDHTHAQLAANRLNVRIFSLVAKNRVSRHHFQIRQLRQAIDEALGDTVTQVFGVWISIGVYEWQDRQRIYRFSASPVPSEAEK